MEKKIEQMGKTLSVSLSASFQTLGQKVYFQGVVLPELMAVIHHYEDDLLELGRG